MLEIPLLHIEGRQGGGGLRKPRYIFAVLPARAGSTVAAAAAAEVKRKPFKCFENREYKECYQGLIKMKLVSLILGIFSRYIF